MRRRFLALLFSLLTPAFSQTLEVSERRAVAASRKIHYGFPRMVRAVNGDLLLFYRVGVTHVYDPSTIVMRRSSDNGVTWSAEGEIHRDPKPDHSATNTVPLVTPSGRILNWLSSFGFQNPNTREPTYWRYSDDHGATWSPMQLFDSDKTRSSYYVTDAINTSDGMLACAATFPPSFAGNCWAVMWHSANGGKTWKVRSNLTSPTENRGDEVALLETSPGSILCLLRARQRPDNPLRKGLYQFRSSDGGKTWVEGENLLAALGCTLQRPVLTRLDKSTILLTGRDFDRKLIVAYISRDNARTFGDRHVVDSYQGDGAYTSAVSIAPGTVLMAYYSDVDSAPRMADIFTVKMKVLPRTRR
ncbi:MAG: sialidase family protein [Bryobacteraceae bacterium]